MQGLVEHVHRRSARPFGERLVVDQHEGRVGRVGEQFHLAAGRREIPAVVRQERPLPVGIVPLENPVHESRPARWRRRAAPGGLERREGAHRFPARATPSPGFQQQARLRVPSRPARAADVQGIRLSGLQVAGQQQRVPPLALPHRRDRHGLAGGIGQRVAARAGSDQAQVRHRDLRARLRVRRRFLQLHAHPDRSVLHRPRGLCPRHGRRAQQHGPGCQRPRLSPAVADAPHGPFASER